MSMFIYNFIDQNIDFVKTCTMFRKHKTNKSIATDSLRTKLFFFNFRTTKMRTQIKEKDSIKLTL